MSKIIRFLKRVFGVYEKDYEYWIRLDQIHIQKKFKRNLINKDKYDKKWKFYREHGYCESKIILDQDFTLIDGYSSYKIYRAAEGKDAKVPVYFVNEE